MPEFLSEELESYLSMLYGLKETERIFQISKSYLHHEMDRGVKLSGVKRIRIHDLRHSHATIFCCFICFFTLILLMFLRYLSCFYCIYGLCHTKMVDKYGFVISFT